MKSLWSDADAQAMVRHYTGQGVHEDVALRVYTSRLLGGEPRLVQHGGGNTSVKTTGRDVLGRDIDVLCVKGSGWDMSDIEPPGLPAVRLAPLLQLRSLPSLSDEEMVNAQRAALLDSAAPNPSVETLLHAWIAPKFVDHTHANAVLALTDQPNGAELCRDIYGSRLALTPYCMPGFSLAQLAARVFEQAPTCEGMILLKHGIFTWGDDARTAYERMIEFVDMAESSIAKKRRKNAPSRATEAPAREDAGPALRGALAEALGAGRFQRRVLDFRNDANVLSFVNSGDLERFSQRGPVTPDHVIRIKPKPLIWSPKPEDALAESARAAVSQFAAEYRTYFERNNARAGGAKRMLDPNPRVILVPGLGLFGAGATAKDARIAADIAVTNIEVILAAESLGGYETIAEADIFDMEYWSLEQAKLGKQALKPLAGQVALITGGAGTIGAATAKALAAHGAEIAIVDRDEAGAKGVAARLGGLGLGCDLTDAAAIVRCVQSVTETYGGLDILVSNAGAAWTGKIGEVSESVLRDSFELNFFAHQRVAQAAVAVMRKQATGGCLLFNASKQALNPGPNFGPYGLPKAATLFLARQYAIDYGADGIRSNAVNADRIRSGLLNDDMIKARAAARGVAETDYLADNILGLEVTADDVAKAFVSLALADRTTAAVLTVDGGNIAAAPR